MLTKDTIMKYKSVISSVLLAFVVFSVGYLIIKGNGGTPVTEADNIEQLEKPSEVSQPEAPPIAQATQPPALKPITSDTPPKSADVKKEIPPPPVELRKLIVYYFHGNVRCPSCRKIEAYAKESVETYFKEKIDEGIVEWQLVNIDEPGNKHFIQDYQLFTRSVVISEVKNGKQTRWKNLDKVWDLLGNKDAFLNYIRNEINQALSGKS